VLVIGWLAWGFDYEDEDDDEDEAGIAWLEALEAPGAWVEQGLMYSAAGSLRY
jgi:hypothetical protein